MLEKTRARQWLDQNGDSSSAASASASAEEGGRGPRGTVLSEKPTRWGPWPPENVSSKQMQSAQPYQMQSATKSTSSWATAVLPLFRQRM